jgi:mannitol-specific phosphotransferase system IIBC component
MREQLQRIGGFWAGMVIPNIGAFIALGPLAVCWPQKRVFKR